MGHVHFDLDLKEEDGAAAVIEVAKDVKRMCKSQSREILRMGDSVGMYSKSSLPTRWGYSRRADIYTVS